MPKKIMLIDDEADILEVLKLALEREGFEVAACGDGRKAGEAVKQFQPDLIVLDLMLPGIDGYSLQTHLAQDEATKNIPVLVLTALEPAKALFQKSPQVRGFVTKPFKTEELLEKINANLSV